jgi:hypothetical protein
MLNMLQQGLKRRAIRQFLDDPGLIRELAGPLDIQTNALMKAATIEQVTAALSGDFSTVLPAFVTGLTNQGLDAATLNSTAGTSILQQLLAMLMSLLATCIPTATSAAILAAIQ